jgi:sugar (glycoside-pentoside-hexuronide) transporter
VEQQISPYEKEPSAGQNGGMLPTGKLSVKTLISYSSSMIGLNGMSTMISLTLMFFYADTLKVGPAVVGTMMALGQVWDAITDPVLGYLSDHTPWKWGRRRPYILLGAPLAAVSFFLLFSPPEKLSVNMIPIFLALVYILFLTSRTIWETPYFALAPELTLDYDERTRLSAYQQVFASFGDILGTMAPVILIAYFAVERDGYSFLGMGIGIIAICAAVSSYAGTRENPALPKRSKLSLLQSLRATLSNRPYVMLVLTSSCTAISNYTTIAVTRFIVKYWFQRPDLEPWFFGAFFIGVFVSIPLWIKLTGRVGKKAAYIFAMVTYSIILWLIMLLGQDDYILYGVCMVIAGAFNIALWLIAGSIVPDIIEWDQLRVKERREGAYYGTWTLIRKGAIGGAFFIVGPTLSFFGYQPDVEQTELALLGIRLLFGPIPSVLLILGVIIFLKFPITKEVHADILRQIEEGEKQGLEE